MNRRHLEKIFLFVAILFESGAFRNVITGRTLGRGAGTSNTVVAIALVIMLITAVLALFKIRKLTEILLRHPALLFLQLYAAASIFWGLNRASTAFYVAGLLGTSLIGYYFVARLDGAERVRMLSGVLAVGIVASLIASLIAPDIAWMDFRGGSLEGVFDHKGTLGRICGLGIIVFWLQSVGAPFLKRISYYFLILLALICLFLAKSATGIVASVVMIVAIPLVLAWQRRAQAALMWTFLGAGFSVLLLAFFIVAPDTLFVILSRDSTLTGRTVLWGLSAAAWLRRPILGYSYGGFWNSAAGGDLQNVIGWQAPSAHNGALGILLDLGIVGLALACLAFFPAMVRSFRQFRKSRDVADVFAFLYLIYVLVNNLVEDEFLKRDSLDWVLIVSCICAPLASATYARFSRQTTHLQPGPAGEMVPG